MLDDDYGFKESLRWTRGIFMGEIKKHLKSNPLREEEQEKESGYVFEQFSLVACRCFLTKILQFALCTNPSVRGVRV